MLLQMQLQLLHGHPIDDLRATYLSHLRPHPPGDFGLLEFGLPRPDADASYALVVRQAGTLLTASFRPRLTTTPFLFG